MLNSTSLTMAEQRVLMKEIQEETCKIEKFYGIQFHYDALLLAVRVAMLPENQTVGEVRERAIDVLNRACESKYRVENNTKQLHKLKYVLRRSLLEYEQLVKQNSDSSNRDSCLSRVEKELKDAFIDLVMFLKKRMYITYDDFVSSVHEAARIQDYSRVLRRTEARVYEKCKETLAIGVQEIAEVASDLTGIPASWFTSKPEERYTKLRERLRKRVFRQDHVVEAIIEVLLNPKAESKSSLGSFLLVGPYGVGKIELAKAIASDLYDDEDRLVRIDMEKYMEPDSLKYMEPDCVSCLVDSLTRTMKNKPYCVVLFDKIDKAHSSVLDTLVSLLSSKSTIDLRNNLVIMTSDVEEEDMRDIKLARVLRPGTFKETSRSKLYKPELLQFLDKTIMMNWRCPLKDIARLLLRAWGSDRNRRAIVIPSDSALTEIVSNASTKHGGNGKGLERWMEEKVYPVMSNMLAPDHPITIFIDTLERTGELIFRLDFGLQ